MTPAETHQANAALDKLEKAIAELIRRLDVAEERANALAPPPRDAIAERIRGTLTGGAR